LQAYFVDLDVKPLEKMPHYFKLDQKIVNFYTKNGEAVRAPCDSPKGGGSTGGDDSKV
jgi:inositol-pentakisphosphate 2-kinase